MSMTRKVHLSSVLKAAIGVLAKVKDSKCQFLFVPGHASIRGNERANESAGLATIDDVHPIDRAGIVNVFREFGSAEYFEKGDLTSMSRMCDESEEWHRKD